MSKPVMLPDFLRRGEPRLLRDVQARENVAIEFVDMKVDPEGRCFLDPEGPIINKENTSKGVVMVERRDNEYHVIIPARTAGRFAIKRDFYPVASITIEQEGDEPNQADKVSG